VKVSLSIGENYPHLFVTNDPGEVRYAENNPEVAKFIEPYVVAEIPDQQWEEYKQAADAYYEQVGKLDKLRDEILAARGRRR
jgi:hypothetical protein